MAFPERFTGRTARFERWSHRAHGPAFAELCADPEVMRFLGGAQPPAAADEVSLRIEAHWEEHGFGLWAAVVGGTCLGFTGVCRPGPRCGPEVAGEVEAGWRLARAGWGRGIATEGAAVAVDAVVAELGLPRVIAMVDASNDRSLAVARRLGMRPSGLEVTSPMGIPVLVLERRTAAVAA